MVPEVPDAPDAEKFDCPVL